MSRHPDNPHGWFYNLTGRAINGLLPGNQFDINTGKYSNIGEGIAGFIGDSLLPGAGTLGVGIYDHFHNQGGTYNGGGFFDSGASMGGSSFGSGFGNSGYGSSAMGGFGGQYGGNMPGQGMFGTGYGTPTNTLAPTPTQVGPFGNTQSAPGRGGDGGGNASGNTPGSSSNIGMNNSRGALSNWGRTQGPDYT